MRVGSAAILLPIALICVWAGGVAFLLLLGFVTAGLLWEWLQLWRGAGGEAAAAARAPALGDSGWRGGHPGFPLLLAGLAAILLAAVCVGWLRSDPRAGLGNLLFLLILVWASDSGAYAAGRMLGGARLAPRISPGKTIAGTVGGLASAILAGTGVALAVSRPTSLWHAAMVAGLLGMVAQAGDLLESYMKRRFGAKDSGRLIPGHGGLLDRLDALLAAALVAAVLALAQGRGVGLWQ